MQKARRRPIRGSDRLWTHGFRFSCTPLSGVLFTFPSRYWSTIGLSGVFSLGGWCRQIQTGFLRPRPTQGTARRTLDFGYTAFTFYGRTFQYGSPIKCDCHVAALQPRRRRNAVGLGFSAFARRYLRNHCCFLFLRVLRCFSSPRSPHIRGSVSSTHWVAPFGNPRIKGHLRLPAAYRSLSRPSSPPRAQASPVRSYFHFSSRVIKIVKVNARSRQSRGHTLARSPPSRGTYLRLGNAQACPALLSPFVTFDFWSCPLGQDSLLSLICLVSQYVKVLSPSICGRPVGMRGSPPLPPGILRPAEIA